MGNQNSNYKKCSTLSVPLLNLKAATNEDIAVWLQLHFQIDDHSNAKEIIKNLRDPNFILKAKSFSKDNDQNYFLHLTFYDTNFYVVRRRTCKLIEK